METRFAKYDKRNKQDRNKTFQDVYFIKHLLYNYEYKFGAFRRPTEEDMVNKTTLDTLINRCVFTKREKQIIQLMKKGIHAEDIAYANGISNRVMRNEILHICEKIVQEDKK